MNKPYFVMLNNQRGNKLIPLMLNDELEMFETFEKAVAGANSSFFGKEFGYEIFQSGCGDMGAYNE